VRVLKGRHLIQELVFSHCGRWLAAGGYGGVHVWDTADLAARPLVPSAELVGALAFRADGRLFYHVCGGQAHLFDPTTKTRTTCGPGLRTLYLVAARDARRAARVCSGSPLLTWTISATGQAAKGLSVQCPGTDIITADFAPDGATFAVVEQHARAGRQESAVVAIRTVASGTVLGLISDAARVPEAVRYSGSGKYLLAFWAETVACWTVAEPGKGAQQAVNPGRAPFVALAVHPSGPLLTTDTDRLVRAWYVPDLAPYRALEWDIGKLHSVAVSPDGTLAAVGSHTGKVLVWDWD
jgi:WD40 repeat protein